jgi:hypothetical protein
MIQKNPNTTLNPFTHPIKLLLSNTGVFQSMGISTSNYLNPSPLKRPLHSKDLSKGKGT